MEQSNCEIPTKVISTYPDLARELVKMISSAEREIYVAPRYYEPAIGSKILAKFAEGVAVHMLDQNPSGVGFEERLRAASVHDSKNRDLILKYLDAPDSIIRVEKFDYSFVVVDGRSCGVEIVDPANPDNFCCAIKLESTTLAAQLIGIFESIARSQKPKVLEKPQTTIVFSSQGEISN